MDWPRHISSDSCTPDCFGCKCLTLRFDKLDERSMDVRKRDKEFAKDSAAYKRLRAEGLQPKGVNKSAMLERAADHKAEVALGRSLTTEERVAHTRDLGAIV